jgi:hypothetical protein
VSRSEQPDPATRRLPRQDIKTNIQCGLTDDDVRWDVPVVKHYSSFFLPFVPLYDAPGFQPGLFNPNEPVNSIDFGQTTVNLGHHLENITDNP